MNISQAGKLLRKSLESILVILYIVFEELIWNTIAEPVYLYFKQLAILKRLERFFLPLNRYLLLLAFILLLSFAEGMGLLSGVLFIRGYLKTAFVIYITKIPIAVLTFWLFNLCQEKLMSFRWLEVSYTWVMDIIHRWVNSAVYQTIKLSVSTTRKQIKSILQRYLKSGGFIPRLKSTYQNIRANVFSIKKGK